MDFITGLAEDIHETAHGHVGIAPNDLPLYRLYAVLCLVKGRHTTKEDVHNAWACWIVGRPDYDPERAPGRYWDLSPDVRNRDAPYQDAIRTVAAKRFAIY